MTTKNTRPPAYQGIDFSQWQSWPKTVSKIDGQTYYQVPGGSGKYFNPYAGANGTVQSLPEQKVESVKNANDAVNPPAKQPGIADSVAPVVGSTAGIVGGKVAVDYATGSGMFAPKVGEEVARTTVSNTSSSVGNGITSNAPPSPPPIPTSNPSASYPTAPDGSTVMSDGTTTTNTLPSGSEVAQDGSIIDSSTGATVGRVAQGAYGAYQIYTGVQEFKKDKVGGSLSVASGAANVAQAAGYQSAGQVTGPLMAAKGAYDTQKGWEHGGEGLRAGTTTLGAGIGTMIMPGVGTVAGAAVGNAIGYGFQGKGVKNDAVLGLVSPGLLVAKKFGLKPHQTTAQNQQVHTQDLLKGAEGDANATNYIQGMRQGFGAPPPDKSKPFFDKYGSFEEYEKAGLDANNLSGVYGNLKLGPAYANLDQQKKAAFTQSQIDKGNYISKKGEVLFKDEAAAQADFDAFNKGVSVAAVPAAPGQMTTYAPNGKPPPPPTGQLSDPGYYEPGRIAPQNMPQTLNDPNSQKASTTQPINQAILKPAVVPTRTTTLSPGIGMNGKPIPMNASRGTPKKR